MAEEQRRHSRTRLNLENCLSLIFLPLGMRRFVQGCNYEIGDLDSFQSQLSLGAAFGVDIGKYFVAFSLVYCLVNR